MWTFYKKGVPVAKEEAGLHGIQFQMRKLGADAAQDDAGDFVRHDRHLELIQGGES